MSKANVRARARNENHPPIAKKNLENVPDKNLFFLYFFRFFPILLNALTMTRTYGNVVVFPALLVFKIYVLFFSNFFQVNFIIFIFLQRRISVVLSSISTGAHPVPDMVIQRRVQLLIISTFVVELFEPLW